MPKTQKTENDHISAALTALVTAALPHVDFDGWSQATLDAAIAESAVDASVAHQACPRGGVDLALAFHRMGDAKMLEELAAADLDSLRFRDKIASAVRFRIEATAPHKEAVRRGVSLFAIPSHAGDGAKALWDTCDKIWTALGDTSQDVNWYTKRTTLSAVYSTTVLYWLGDDSEDSVDTWAFLDRRIENVMQFETLKSKVKNSPLASFLGHLTEKMRKPDTSVKQDLPGFTKP